MTSTGRHMPGLTGLRGVAVALVVAYHLGHLGGGFVGVDVFFVLSGFLITTLLLGDTPSTSGDMFRWWGRRVRRLTPAVAVTVIAVAVAFATSSGIAVDGLATLTWWQNWHLIIEGNPYWAGTPSPLRHAWSLSIEEQFYLVWPPLLVGITVMATRLRRRPPLLVGITAAVGFVASFLWAAWSSLPRDADLSRLYYGTDTRVGALMLGCAIAAYQASRPPRRPGRPAGLPLTVAAAASAGVLGVMAVVISPSERWAYQGGLAVTAVAAAVVVVASSRPGRLTSILGWAPLQWLGTRSYAIYLWSWPTQVFVQQHGEGLHDAVVALITVAVSLTLSSVSLRLVEDPLRRATSWARAVRLRRIAWYGGTALVAVTLIGAANSTEPTVVEKLEKEFERQPDPTVPPGPTTTCLPGQAPPPPTWGQETTKFDPDTIETVDDPTGARCSTVVRLLVVGDSTGRGAANGLRRLAPPGIEIWDRTELGCGLVPPDDKCPDWRSAWAAAVTEIVPDLVLVYLGVSDDVVPAEDPPFLSDEAGELRRREIAAAIDLLSSQGADVAWALPAVQRGTFYCEGRADDTVCDPDWVQRWHEDVLAVADGRGTATIDVREWIAARPEEQAETDRPDGLHLSGPALDEHAAWLADRLSPSGG